jgi:hypothetical protein
MTVYNFPENIHLTLIKLFKGSLIFPVWLGVFVTLEGAKGRTCLTIKY